MKAYIITEEQMQSLLMRIKFEWLLANNYIGDSRDAASYENDKLYRGINLAVHRWKDEVGS